MKARDLMIPLKEYLKPDQTLKEAVNLLRTARRSDSRIGVKGLPVLDAGGKLVGMLSMGDILKAVWPPYMAMMDLGEFTWDGMVESLAQRVSDHKVETAMSGEVITVEADAPLMECVDHMIKNKVRRLPVIGKGGEVLGMIYERDVFFAITKAMLHEDGGEGK
ncbi:MAG: CBS domain-containing protein [Nitrospirae bacterium]|nr:CBS domain-containing protein [Nitrospirota bacterium]